MTWICLVMCTDVFGGFCSQTQRFGGELGGLGSAPTRVARHSGPPASCLSASQRSVFRGHVVIRQRSLHRKVFCFISLDLVFLPRSLMLFRPRVSLLDLDSSLPSFFFLYLQYKVGQLIS